MTAEDGPEAIEAYRTALSEGTRFDGVVLDLTIPGGIGGQEVAKEILSFDSKARLMASSGYSDDLVMSDFSRYGFMAALPKPYGLEQLCRAVSQLLVRPGDEERL